jgi:hypothetical protein
MHFNTCRFDTGAGPVKHFSSILNFNQMKTKKLSLNGIRNELSREELREISAGSTGGGGGGGGGNCPIPCAPNCNNSVLLYCHDASGLNLGTVLGNTCNQFAQVQECDRVYPTTTWVMSDCLC